MIGLDPEGGEHLAQVERLARVQRVMGEHEADDELDEVHGRRRLLARSGAANGAPGPSRFVVHDSAHADTRHTSIVRMPFVWDGDAISMADSLQRASRVSIQAS